MADGIKPIHSRTGATRDGLPLSFGRVPPADLRPWIARLSVSEVVLRPGEAIACRMLHDHTVLRVIYGARWTAQTADGTFEYDPGAHGIALLFGPQSHAMRLTVYGSFKILTLNFAAGASLRLGGPKPVKSLDRIFDYDELAGRGTLSSHFSADMAPSEWLDVIEDRLRRMLARIGPEQPDELTRAFEAACLAYPNIAVAEFAERHAVARRTLERTIRRDFGLTPKHVLRRSRACDMAAMLLGVALAEEEDEMRLRYADESHLIREMRHFFDLTPGQLRNGRHPLLRITMEIRQQHRLEQLARLTKGDPRPWRDPEAEPGA